MAKRFTDTDKWKKGFIKSLPTPYKIFWLYLCDDCSNTGIWETNEIEVALTRTGEDFDLKTALKNFNKSEKRIIPFDSGKKWFIPSFVTFQYGQDFALKGSKNRLIQVVIDHLTRLDLIKHIPVTYPLERVLDGEQEQYKDMDKEYKGGSRGKPGRLWKCFVGECGKEMPESERAAHMDAHQKEVVRR